MYASELKAFQDAFSKYSVHGTITKNGHRVSDTNVGRLSASGWDNSRDDYIKDGYTTKKEDRCLAVDFSHYNEDNNTVITNVRVSVEHDKYKIVFSHNKLIKHDWIYVDSGVWATLERTQPTRERFVYSWNVPKNAKVKKYNDGTPNERTYVIEPSTREFDYRQSKSFQRVVREIVKIAESYGATGSEVCACGCQDKWRNAEKLEEQAELIYKEEYRHCDTCTCGIELLKSEQGEQE